MKKKLIIIILVTFVLLGILLLVLFSGQKTETLECSKEEVKEGKKASIYYEYIIHSNGDLHSKATIDMTFISKEEADKYEAASRLAFLKDNIIRKDNNITILSEKEEQENELSRDDIKSKMESQGFICN